MNTAFGLGLGIVRLGGLAGSGEDPPDAEPAIGLEDESGVLLLEGGDRLLLE